MKTTVTNKNIVKWIILYVVSANFGTFVLQNLLYKIDINIWVARGCGALITAITALLLYHFLHLGVEKKV